VWRTRFGPVVRQTTEWMSEFQDLPFSHLQSAVQKKFLRLFLSHDACYMSACSQTLLLHTTRWLPDSYCCANRRWFCRVGGSVFRRARKIAKSDYQLRHVCLSVCLPVRPPTWYRLAPSGWIFMKRAFFENLW
jgi:hypothetical protein